MKVIKVQLSPTPKQKTLLNVMMEEHRKLYNNCLSKKIEAYKENKKNLSCFDLIKSEIKFLKEKGELPISNFSSCQQTIRRLDKAYKTFFNKGGFPRFKGMNRFNTVEYSKRGDGNQIKNGKFYLQNIGEIKALWFLNIEEYKTLSITKKVDKFYVNFIIEDEVVPPNKTEKSIGIDFGLKTFLTTSDGEKIDSPKFHKKTLKEEAKIHRRIHKAEKKSKRREKHKKTLAKLKSKTSNKRRDFNHKISKRLIDENDVIILEDINLSKLKSEIKNVNRSYRDVAFEQFRQFLTYKAEKAGKIVVKINPAYTTQECFSCGKINKLSLLDRTFTCPCGYKEDRDVNAAKNILRRGLASLDENPRGSRIYSGE